MERTSSDGERQRQAQRHVAGKPPCELSRAAWSMLARAQDAIAFHAGSELLSSFIRVAGVSWAALFVTVGPYFQLHFYGDGSLFAYAVAVEDTWAYHWHNIPSRTFVHLFAHVPAETFIRLTGNAAGGVAIYGLLFFSAPLLGLVTTYIADRSEDRTIFTFACLSTACLTPLVFGFPTEMWIAHSVFWPGLAVSHYACRDPLRTAAGWLLLLALVFTHEGALILATAVLATVALRGARDLSFVTLTAAYFVILCLWLAVKLELPPDDYFSSVLLAAARSFIDVTALADNPILLIFATLAGYAVVFAVLRLAAPQKAHVFSTLIIAGALGLYWVWFDRSLHAEHRYAFRTALILATPVLGALAGLSVVRKQRPLPFGGERLVRLPAGFCLSARPAATALALVMLVHAVETVKFINAWTKYKFAVQTLATGSDPLLEHLHVASAAHVGDELNRLSWSSTTPYLSVLVAPGFLPKRLVVESEADYHWLSCQLATATYEARRSVPKESRRLVREHACLRRPY